MTKSQMPEWVKQELARADEAVAHGTLEQAAQPRATAAHYDARKKVLVIELVNGASFAFPPSLAQGLDGASAADLSAIEITPMGTGLHWPRLDADLTVDGLLAGVFGSRSWMRAHAARAGSARSPAKTAAARANGVKGGRPRKQAVVPA
jgi:Protein of unknown function (DUF2442)